MATQQQTQNIPFLIRSPSEKYKDLIIDILRKGIYHDIDLNKAQYISSVKHFARLSKMYAPKEVVDLLENEYESIQSKITSIAKDKSEQQRKEEKQKIEYEGYDQIQLLSVDCLMNSPIIDKDVEGILLSGPSMADLKKIQQTIRHPLKTGSLEKR